MKRLIALATVALFALPSHAADKIGIFETIHQSSVSFEETTAAFEAAVADSGFELHASIDVRVPEEAHQARVYVMTSPDFIVAARSEPPRTISAQILRVAVFTWGDEQTAMINMANPVAHAMVYYAESTNYDDIIAAAYDVSAGLRALAAAVPGEAIYGSNRLYRVNDDRMQMLEVERVGEREYGNGSTEVTMDKIVNLSKRRGFVFPSSEIYGGLGSCWDYGPLGAEFKNNLKARWWQAVVRERDDVEGIDSTIIAHPRTWDASGHTEHFSDPMVDCRTCKARFRADQVDDDVLRAFAVDAGAGAVRDGRLLPARRRLLDAARQPRAHGSALRILVAAHADLRRRVHHLLPALLFPKALYMVHRMDLLSSEGNIFCLVFHMAH